MRPAGENEGPPGSRCTKVLIMTAIYSFVSQSKKVAFIAADSVDGASGQKVDKVTLVGQRFAIATYGSGVVTTALEAIVAFEAFDNVTSPEGVENILEKAWEITRKLCEMHYNKKREAKERGEVSDLEWRVFQSSITGIIILDCQEYKLFELKADQLFPPPTLTPFTNIMQKESGLLHLTEFARLAAGKDTENFELEPLDTEEILKFLKRRIERDKIKVKNLGNLGTVVIVEEGKITYNTAFDGAMDYMTDSIRREMEILE